MAHPASTHPGSPSCKNSSGRLEKVLLSGDATAVETASAQVQAAMSAAPRPAETKNWGPPCRPSSDMAALRLSQLRQTVGCASAQNDRVLNNLLPGQAKHPPTDASASPRETAQARFPERLSGAAPNRAHHKRPHPVSSLAHSAQGYAATAPH
ncbi:MAG: hypothetical protein R3E42_06905 [Burkholderiaceae bacterium]